MSKQKNPLLGLSLIGLALLIIFLGDCEEEVHQQTKKRTENASDRLERVNDHLTMTHLRKTLNEAKVDSENKSLAPSLNSSLGSNFLEETGGGNGLDLSNDNRGELLTQSLGRGPRQFSLPRNPREMIHTELFNQDQDREYSEAYKAAYAREFIENAKREGYLIKLNSEYKIISVTPIRDPSSEQPNLLELSNGQTGGAR